MTDWSTPPASRSERLWAHPGLRPLSAADSAQSPLSAYRWEFTDAALAAQLELEAEGHSGTVEAGHAAISFVNPATGGDALVTMRTEMHRLAPGARTGRRRDVGSSVWQVFDGSGAFELDGQRTEVQRGDVIAVPSWCPIAIDTAEGLDLFRFSDAPVIERLNLARSS